MTIHNLPLVHDRRMDRTTPVAAVEITETDLALIAAALANQAITGPAIFHGDSFDCASLARRFQRLKDDLHRQTQKQIGAAPADTGRRPDQEVLAP